jgi:putative 3-deoxy-D-manno-octulosonic-acid transferase
VMNSLVNSDEKRQIVGKINRDYIATKKGATSTFLKGIEF